MFDDVRMTDVKREQPVSLEYPQMTAAVAADFDHASPSLHRVFNESEENDQGGVISKIADAIADIERGDRFTGELNSTAPESRVSVHDLEATWDSLNDAQKVDAAELQGTGEELVVYADLYRHTLEKCQAMGADFEEERLA